ncbi:carboxymuconolactone decarboxylase family protein [Paenibacillus azoreducens]|uniref:carboxymuconolactone decarboxylase family protein n=1 Tax=Paenibacillus azoreducens TaxID=116718 RepID=UPI0039F4AB52
MTLRFNYRAVSPHVYQAMVNLQKADSASSIDPVLRELIKIRVSQINGCSFCLDMHAKDLLKLGDYQDHILLLNVWREAPLYSGRERAALELAEAVTRISEQGVPEAVYKHVREHYDENEYMELILAINTINSWNRIAISTGMFPGCFS